MASIDDHQHHAGCSCRFDAQCLIGRPEPVLSTPPVVLADTAAVPDTIDWGPWEEARDDVWRRKVTHTWGRGITVFAQWHWDFKPIVDVFEPGRIGESYRWQGDF